MIDMVSVMHVSVTYTGRGKRRIVSSWFGRVGGQAAAPEEREFRSAQARFPSIRVKVKPQTAIESRLTGLRKKRGMAAAELAHATGVSRQTIYAIEAGTYVPNTAIALRLAQVLESTVEEMFCLADPSPALSHSEQALPLPGCEPPQPDQPVQLCRVDKRLMAMVPPSGQWYLPPSDAIATAHRDDGKTAVEILHPERDWGSRLLVAGCDPAMSILARHLRPAGIELVLAHRNSSQALKLLKQGLVHVAGTHLRDEASGESNLPEIRRQFPKGSIAVISFSIWEEGIVTARDNPKRIRGVADLARPDVSMVNRESGSGSRCLLEAQLKLLGIAPRQIRGYDQIALGHLPGAWQVRSGAVDCCIATRSAAKTYGLGFVPLASERYDFAIRKKHLELPAIETLLDALSRAKFRRELETLGGYDTRTAGQRML
jgi:molybdate-binding protein/DNA-binding XRE family transcriptional regulator